MGEEPHGGIAYQETLVVSFPLWVRKMSEKYLVATRNSVYFLIDSRPNGGVSLIKLCNIDGEIDGERLEGNHWNMINGVVQVWREQQLVIRTSSIRSMTRIE
ncbi:MAG: hypothetical protein AUJ24_00855 [Parcubacteria group bacterium CG1_02_36_42]|nr:MAG: hypothetical protein AUJ24_00855 [Parcubacteria group bacterium CG1_02_36_42]